ncbi:hypothetical protein AURDEDRAFT_20846, partial [Auricularia subglabra TFB-10046 SS5]
PPWARIGPEDDALAGKYTHVRPLPSLLKLDDAARCRCGADVDPSAPLEEVECTVYDHDCAFPARIQARRCTECPRKSRMAAGPDLGGVGLFNLNNSTVLSHALLNKYDAQLSAGETPFHAFCTAVDREYQMYGSRLPFLHPDRFRTAWFSFMAVQECRDGYTCKACGTVPEVVLVDGVTVGYPKRRKTGSLRPPTHTCKSSSVRRDVRPAK